LQPDQHPRLLGLVLQPESLKLESRKFNIIINIINITLGSSVAVRPKALRYIFAERPNTFRSQPFLYFLCKKKNLTRGVCLCFFSFSFPFEAFYYGLHSAVHSEKVDAFSFIFLAFSLCFLIIFFNFLS
jgi:hypothetical protein